MFIPKKQKGEKAVLLDKCGESLFGCPGETLLVQGIYIPKSLLPTANYICKRSVWVPLSLSHECLAQHLESFGATLPFSIQKVMSLHRIGLCGVNPTRTVHAIDKCFLILAKIPNKHFVVYGIVEIGRSQHDGVVSIEYISTDNDDIMNCVEWIKSEIATHHFCKRPKKRRVSHSVVTDKPTTEEGQSSETERGTQTTLLGAQHDMVQLTSVTTESETSTNTSEPPAVVPGNCASVPSTCYQYVSVPSQNTIVWLPCLPQQSSTGATNESTPFYVLP